MKEQIGNIPEEQPDPVHGTNILVTGGTGSFGQRFVANALGRGARRVVVLSRDELKQAEMAERFRDNRLRFFIGDVANPLRMIRAVKGVDVVVHAAALKRIDACEAEPDEAVRVNIQGAQSVVRACIENGVRRAVFLSTDKAAAPVTLYGATKLTAERLWVRANVYAAGGPTSFVATRYGNVLGSRGSVLERWRKLVEAGERIPVTDPDMTRFWMTLDDAVELVWAAITKASPGEIIVPPVKSSSVAQLVAAVRAATGFQVETYQVGIRRGEKRHEVLVAEDEARYVHDAGTHFAIQPEPTWTDDFEHKTSNMPEGWSLRSDTAPRLSVSELQRMMDW